MVDPILATQSATEKGTRIVKKGHEMDKNAFLKILTAELTNQDPSNTKDSTAYVSQLAQFASLEQMSNLNSTMSFNSASTLVGKVVALNAYDDYGNQYGGTVMNVNRVGDTIKLTVNVAKYKGNEVVGYEEKEFAYGDLSDVIDLPDSKTQALNYLNQGMSYLNINMNFMAASGLLNKSVELTEADGEQTYSGKVLEVYKIAGVVKLKVALDDGTEKEFYYSEVTKVKNSLDL